MIQRESASIVDGIWMSLIWKYYLFFIRIVGKIIEKMVWYILCLNTLSLARGGELIKVAITGITYSYELVSDANIEEKKKKRTR